LFYRDFHGDNTGSNPVGDANQFKGLALTPKVSQNDGDSVGTMEGTMPIVIDRSDASGIPQEIYDAIKRMGPEAPGQGRVSSYLAVPHTGS
jgi:hypothetical protein